MPVKAYKAADSMTIAEIEMYIFEWALPRTRTAERRAMRSRNAISVLTQMFTAKERMHQGRANFTVMCVHNAAPGCADWKTVRADNTVTRKRRVLEEIQAIVLLEITGRRDESQERERNDVIVVAPNDEKTVELKFVSESHIHYEGCVLTSTPFARKFAII